MRVRQLDLPLSSSQPPLEPRRNAPAVELDDLPFDLPPPIPPTPAGRAERGSRPRPERDEILSSARSLAESLAHELNRPVRLYVTDNRATMVSFRRSPKALHLRVHHMFLKAPPDVVRALAEYAGRGDREAGPVIDGFVRANGDAIRAGETDSRLQRLNPRGQVWDLRKLYERVNATEFDNRIEARIGWGRAVQPQRRRSIRMGVYDHLSRTIRVHPALDRVDVPEFFVEYIVFHEMLHQAIPCREEGGRRQHHPREFRERERAYHAYDRAIEWERRNLHLLLGKPASRRRRPVD